MFLSTYLPARLARRLPVISRPGEPALVVSFTTIPSRIDRIRPMLVSILTQSVLPHRIYLQLPYESIREKQAYHLPDWLVHPRLQIHWTRDVGPFTKLYPMQGLVTPPTLVVTVDDDSVYHHHLLRDLLRAHRQFPDACVGAIGRIIPSQGWTASTKIMGANLTDAVQVDLLEGYGGVLYPSYTLPRLEDFASTCPAAYTVDDVWIAHCLADVPKWVVPMAVPEPIPWAWMTRLTNPLWAINEADERNEFVLNALRLSPKHHRVSPAADSTAPPH